MRPTPKAAGSTETFVVTGLSSGRTYYFALKTADGMPNWSPISNSPSATTTGQSDTIAPAAVTNLTAGGATSSSIMLSWTAPGDNGTTGTASTYSVRYLEGAAITESNWASATQCTGMTAPKTAGSGEAFVVTGLAASKTYFFALKTADAVPNWSAISNIARARRPPQPLHPLSAVAEAALAGVGSAGCSLYSFLMAQPPPAQSLPKELCSRQSTPSLRR